MSTARPPLPTEEEQPQMEWVAKMASFQTRVERVKAVTSLIRTITFGLGCGIAFGIFTFGRWAFGW